MYSKFCRILYLYYKIQIIFCDVYNPFCIPILYILSLTSPSPSLSLDLSCLSLQARYLVDHDPHLSLPAILAIAAVYFSGYFIFRSSNSQKDAFRRDPAAPEVR